MSLLAVAAACLLGGASQHARGSESAPGVELCELEGLDCEPLRRRPHGAARQLFPRTQPAQSVTLLAPSPLRTLVGPAPRGLVGEHRLRNGIGAPLRC